MPRGRRIKLMNPSEEIVNLDRKIEKLTEEIRVLKETRKTLTKKQEEQEIAEKLEKIKNSGYSLDEILEMVGRAKG